MSLLNSQVPSRFRFYVDNELKKERMGNEIERVYGRTNHGQLFCFITSEKSRYAVRLIIYEEYQHLRIQRERGVHRLRKKEYFTTREDASNFVKEKVRKYSNGELDIYAFRVRLVPMERHVGWIWL
uniref:Uncharacterized protein n=1 Tax=Panagrolaimus davidi TaxID=227884 RepID=A0A914PMY9_9BILA